MPEANRELDSKAGALWFPGKKMEGLLVAPLSARGLEIAQSQEDLLRLLHDLPESEYELSLTDLVEKGSAAGNPVSNKNTSLREGELNKATMVKERKKRRSSSRSSFGSSSGDGVLLNFYVPPSLSRSLTTTRSSRRPASLVTDCKRRDEELTTFGCWSALWQRRGRSRRQKLEIE